MNNQHLLSTVVMGISAVILTGCGGGGSSGSSASSDSGSQFQSSLQISDTVVKKEIVSRKDPKNSLNPEYFAYQFSNQLKSPIIARLRFRLDPADPNHQLELFYNTKTKTLLNANYYSGEQSYPCICDTIRTDFFEPKSGNIKLTFNNTEFVNFVINGSLIGSLYATPLEPASIPQTSSGFIQIGALNYKIFSSIYDYSFTKNSSERSINGNGLDDYIETTTTTKTREKIGSFSDNGNAIHTEFESLEEITKINGEFFTKKETKESILYGLDHNTNGFFSTLHFDQEVRGLSHYYLSSTDSINIKIENTPIKIRGSSLAEIVNGSIMIPKPHSTLKINNQPWTLGQFHKKDLIVNNLIIRSFEYFDNDTDLFNNETLSFVIKGSDVIGVTYLHPKNKIKSTCGFGTSTTCTGIKISSDYNHITFDNTFVDTIPLNGSLSFNLR